MSLSVSDLGASPGVSLPTFISELAGELKDYYPVCIHLTRCPTRESNNYLQDKKVVIVHGRNLLLNEQFPENFRKLVNQKLEARGVELVLGDYVAKFPENGGGEVVLRSGKKLQADLVVRPSPYHSVSVSIGTSLLTCGRSRFLRTGPNQTLLGYPMLWAKIHSHPKDL